MCIQKSDGSTNGWIRATCSFTAGTEEEVNLHVSSPQMRSLLRALELVGQVAGEKSWCDTHDPGGKLKLALESLLHVTRIRKPEHL